MLDRACLGAGRNLDDIVGHEVAAPVRVREAAACVVAVPAAGLEREKIVPEIEMDRNPLAIGPIEIWIDKEPAGQVVGCFRRIIHGRNPFKRIAARMPFARALARQPVPGLRGCAVGYQRPERS
jgi:hypothetical protein